MRAVVRERQRSTLLSDDAVRARGEYHRVTVDFSRQHQRCLPKAGRPKNEVSRYVKRVPPCRVLHIFDSLALGGAEVWLMQLLEHFRKSGDSEPPRFEVLLTSGERSVLDEEAERLGARLHYARFGLDRVGP